jgi:hypothetical protein
LPIGAVANRAASLRLCRHKAGEGQTAHQGQDKRYKLSRMCSTVQSGI